MLQQTPHRRKPHHLHKRLENLVAAVLVPEYFVEQRRAQERLDVVHFDLGGLLGEFVDLDRDRIRHLVAAGLRHEEAGTVLDEMAEEERENLLVVLGDSQILAETALELLAHARLLRRDKAADRHLDGEVDVVGPDKLAEVHLGARLRHANDGFEVTDRDGERPGRDRLATELGVQARDLFLVHHVQLRLDAVSRVLDVLAEEVLRDQLRKFNTGQSD